MKVLQIKFTNNLGTKTFFLTRISHLQLECTHEDGTRIAVISLAAVNSNTSGFYVFCDIVYNAVEGYLGTKADYQDLGALCAMLAIL